MKRSFVDCCFVYPSRFPLVKIWLMLGNSRLYITIYKDLTNLALIQYHLFMYHTFLESLQLLP